MIEILLAVILVAMLIAAMAVGVLFGKKPISGSCGGVAAALGEPDYSCEICGGDPMKCDETVSEIGADPFYTEISANKKDS